VEARVAGTKLKVDKGYVNLGGPSRYLGR
jgi:hypothetical protein